MAVVLFFTPNNKLINFDKNKKYKALTNSVNVARPFNLQCVNPGVTSI